YYLLKEGINPDRDFSRIAFSGAHDATVAFVASGRAEAGVLNSSVYDKLVERGDANAKAVRILARTPPYYDYNWTVRGDLDVVLVKKLTSAFLGLDPAKAAHKEILDAQRASRFIPTKPENYREIEHAAREAGLLN
ncbi:MAG: PhnD/SsuA/transferrin family substrate-binding protein, partial [Betaproteobacteria bacterium]